MYCTLKTDASHSKFQVGLPGWCRRRILLPLVPLHYVHFVKYDDAVSFYDAVSDTIRRRGGNRGIFTEEGVDTVAYFGGNHGSRV